MVRLTKKELTQLQALLHKAMLEAHELDADAFDLCDLYGLDMQKQRSVASGVASSIKEKLHGLSSYIDHRIAK